MNSNTRLEIKARVFTQMNHGYLAPYKDEPAALNGSQEDRWRVWSEWLTQYGPVVEMTLRAVEQETERSTKE